MIKKITLRFEVELDAEAFATTYDCWFTGGEIARHASADVVELITKRPTWETMRVRQVGEPKFTLMSIGEDIGPIGPTPTP